ncbi:Atrial natriuretic peptide receptor 1 [Hypsibius exemplaris]|uniref:guanylate cyclase n=1 Tax=Hypsibius exemplaris TaxID=2072580 RepID=A0A1W0XE99_HYPEX|nr:Atrial natriuretic peptide receptor 1 [Hypsibius exemplaris]
MTNGDYVYVSIAPLEYPHPDFGNFTWQNFDALDTIAKEAYKSLLLIRPVSTDVNSTKRETFFRTAIGLSKTEYNYTYGRRLNITEMPSPFTISSYASIYMLAQVLNETQRNGSRQPFVSANLASKFYDRCFATPLGEFCFDRNGQRRIGLEVTQYSPLSDALDKQIFNVDKFNLSLVALQAVTWATGPTMTWPVPNIPLCGFSGQEGECADQGPRYTITWTVATSVSLLVLIISACVLARRVMLNDAQLQSQRWEIDLSLLQKPFTEDGDALDRRFGIPPRTEKLPDATEKLTKTVATVNETGKACLKEQAVWIKSYKTCRRNSVMVKPSKKFQRCLNNLYDLRHPNLVAFMGVVTQAGPDITLLVNEWCSRGNVREMMDTNRVQVDWQIKNSLISDLVQGLRFIHQSTFTCHGSLTPNVCLVDVRLTLKIAELGYREILTLGFGVPTWDQVHGTDDTRLALYNAPEVMTSSDGTRTETPEADVFAVGKIIQGIATDFGWLKLEGPVVLGPDCPWMTKQEVLLCLKPNPRERPTALRLVRNLARTNSRLLGKIIVRMGAYAEELEEAVVARTLELEEEQRRCDMLLLEMIPVEIVHKLRHGMPVHPELFDSVSLSFSNLIGFLDFITLSAPLDVIRLLNTSHGLFDQVIMGYDVYKVETIGDSYFLSSGLPDRNGHRHAFEISSCAVQLRQAFESDEAIKECPVTLQIQAGIHSGACVASVVGLKMPRYCLFGDTVNTASRMESYGEPSKIHISTETMALLPQGSFRLESRGSLSIRGKGEMETYWLEPAAPSNIELIF